MGSKNLNKVFVLRVMPMTEEAIIAQRRSHARIIRPRKWHITKWGHIIEKELPRGGEGEGGGGELTLIWLKRWWLPSHLMHPTKPPGCIYVEKILKQYCLGCPDLQRADEGVWWDKYLSSGMNDQQMEDQDYLKGTI